VPNVNLIIIKKLQAVKQWPSFWRCIYNKANKWRQWYIFVDFYVEVLLWIWPLNVVDHRKDPRYTSLLESARWAIVRQNPPTGHFSRLVEFFFTIPLDWDVAVNRAGIPFGLWWSYWVCPFIDHHHFIVLPHTTPMSNRSVDRSCFSSTLRMCCRCLFVTIFILTQMIHRFMGYVSFQTLTCYRNAYVRLRWWGVDVDGFKPSAKAICHIRHLCRPIWHTHWPAVWSWQDGLLQLGTLWRASQQHPEVAECARIVLQAPRRSHAKPLMRQRHWLPVQHKGVCVDILRNWDRINKFGKPCKVWWRWFWCPYTTWDKLVICKNTCVVFHSIMRQ